MEKTGKKRRAVRSIRNAVLPVAITLSAIGCSTLGDIFINSDMGKQAVFQTEYKFVKTFDEQYRIEDFGYFSNPDSCPEKPILLFNYGFGGTEKELVDEEREEKISRLSVMKEVFDNRVLIANYPSSASLSVIFSNFEKSFLDFINNYMEKNNGKKPRLFVLGHSMGAEISRMLARKDSEYIEKVGLLAGVNDGLNMGPFTDFIRYEYPKYLEKILIEKGRPHSKEYYQSIDDLIRDSSFLNELNTLTGPLDVEYNIYALKSRSGNLLISGDNDGVVSLESSYPFQLIKDKKFEDVRIGDAMIIEGDVDHFSTTNLFALKTILESLKSEKEAYSYELPEIDKANRLIIPKCPPLEQKTRDKEKRLMQEAGIK